MDLNSNHHDYVVRKNTEGLEYENSMVFSRLGSTYSQRSPHSIYNLPIPRNSRNEYALKNYLAAQLVIKSLTDKCLVAKVCEGY